MYSEIIGYLLAILSFTTFKQISADFGFLFIANEELIVLICFISFVIFSYRMLSDTVSSMLSERRANINASLFQSLGRSEEEYNKELKEQQLGTLRLECIKMIKDSITSPTDSLRSMISPLCMHRINIIKSQQARSSLLSCYRFQSAHHETLKQMLTLSFGERSVFSISKLRKKNKK